MNHRAVFLDRDGTLVHARHYPSRPDDLVLYSGVVSELATLSAAGFALIVVTNQSGIARGLFTTEALDRMHDHLRRELEAGGAYLDAIYICPHHPEGSVAGFTIDCNCRKPRPGMLLQAARDLGIDLNRSWLVGDILDDVEAGNRAGCRTVLVDLGTERMPQDPIRSPDLLARSTVHALQMIQSIDANGTPVDLHYLPPTWRGPATSARIECDLVGTGADGDRAGG